MSKPEDILTGLDNNVENTGIENGAFESNIDKEEEKVNVVTTNVENNGWVTENYDEETRKSIIKKRKQPKQVFVNDDDDHLENVELGNLDGLHDSIIHDSLIKEKDANNEDSTDIEDLENANFITKSLIVTRSFLYHLIFDNEKIFVYLLLLALVIVYAIFFGFAVHHGWNTTYSYCDGVKFLFIITVLVVVGLVYYQIVKRFFGKILNKHCVKPMMKLYEVLWEYRFVRWLLYVVLIAATVTFLVIDSKNNRARLISAAGIIVLTLLGFIFSKHPGRIIWRHVFWGLGLQFLLALLVLRWEVGREIFQCLGDKVQLFLDYTDQGSSFVFGYLVTGNLTGWTNVTKYVGPYEVFNGTDIALPLQEQLFGFHASSTK